MEKNIPQKKPDFLQTFSSQFEDYIQINNPMVFSATIIEKAKKDKNFQTFLEQCVSLVQNIFENSFYLNDLIFSKIFHDDTTGAQIMVYVENTYCIFIIDPSEAKQFLLLDWKPGGYSPAVLSTILLAKYMFPVEEVGNHAHTVVKADFLQNFQ